MPTLSDIKKKIKELHKNLDDIEAGTPEFDKLAVEIYRLEKEKDDILDSAKRVISEAEAEAEAKEVDLDVEVVKNKKNKLFYALEWLKKRYCIKYTLFTELSEIKGKNELNFRNVDEHLFLKIRSQLLFSAGIEVPVGDLDMILTASHIVKEYNPIEDYINNLPKYTDADPNHIKEFLSFVKLKDEAERDYFIKVFTKWMVGLIAGLVTDHEYNHTIFVLVSNEQGLGKTSFFTHLVPEHLRLNYYYVGNYQIEKNKDHEEMIGTKMLINLDELATLNKADTEALKTRVTQPSVTVRRAYGRKSTYLWHRASFCGSINWEGFLTDQSGNRRWLPFVISGVDLASLKDFNIDKVYSQAFALYKKKYQFYFDLSEIQELERHNEAFRNVSMEEELIATHYTAPTGWDIESGSIRYVTTTEIANELAMKYTKINVNDSYKNKLGRSLKKLGFTTVKRRPVGSTVPLSVWCVKDIYRNQSGNISYSTDLSAESAENESKQQFGDSFPI